MTMITNNTKLAYVGFYKFQLKLSFVCHFKLWNSSTFSNKWTTW